MKNRLHWIIILMLSTLGSASLVAQERSITEAEFNTVTEKGWAKLRAVSYRMKMTSERYRNASDSVPYYFINDVVEYSPPDRRRAVSIWRTPEGIKRFEKVEIGDRKFSKKNDEPWIDETKKQADRFTVKGDAVENKEKKVFRMVGSARVGKVDAEIFESVTIREYQTGPNDLISEYRERFWVDRNGLFVKRESKSIENGTKIMSHTIWEYEYVANLRIEAPIE